MPKNEQVSDAEKLYLKDRLATVRKQAEEEIEEMYEELEEEEQQDELTRVLTSISQLLTVALQEDHHDAMEELGLADLIPTAQEARSRINQALGIPEPEEEEGLVPEEEV